METNAFCPICEKSVPSNAPLPDVTEVQCRICGHYFLTFELALEFVRINPYLLPYLSAATRQAANRRDPLTLTTENYYSRIEEHRYTTASGKAAKLLGVLATKSGHYGHIVEFHYQTEFPLIDAVSSDEARGLIDYLLGRKLIGRQNESEYALTMDGWEKLEPLTTGGIPGRCFVAMAFKGSLDPAFTEGIKAAIEIDCGFTAIRMLDLQHNDKICDRIIVELRKAQFVIADFTYQRGGVYFEAGFAAALGRPVIWTCKACHFHRLHFDTRQYNHIKWQRPGDLRTQLAARIRGTIPGARLVTP